MKKLQKMKKILYTDEEDRVAEANSSVKNVQKILRGIREVLNDINVDVYLTSENRIVVTEQRKALEEIDKLLREANV